MAEPSTIAALATPPGKSALAILRISGPDVFTIVGRCLSERASFSDAPPNRISLFTAADPETGAVIDQITAIKYAASKSFTGENMVELICHGGPTVIDEIVSALLGAGARQAGRGEFTRRALLNGKIDLLKAEAIRGIIESESEAELSCARKLYTSGGHPLAAWREELMGLLAHVELGIEFEEESDAQVSQAGKKKIEEFLLQLQIDIKKREQIAAFGKGFSIVIAGPVNAGKSTLFNALLGYNRVIVHSTPGTTRDIISEQVRIGGYPVRLVDSAGIRETGYEIELAGIARSREEIQQAGLVVWVTAADEPFYPEEAAELCSIPGGSLLCVVNKIDAGDGSDKTAFIREKGIEPVPVSLKLQKNGAAIFERLCAAVKEAFRRIEVPDLLLNERHQEIGRRLLHEIESARGEWKRQEIAAFHLKRAISCLEEFFGTTDPEEIMNRIFEGFCIGK